MASGGPPSLGLGPEGGKLLERLERELTEAVTDHQGALSREAAARRVVLTLEGLARQQGLQRPACRCEAAAPAAAGHCESCGLRVEGDAVEMFGSFSNGFQTGSSDMDVVLLTERGCDQKQKLAKLKEGLDARLGFDNITQIFEAKVPLLKFTDLRSGMEIDFCVNNELGVRNSLLLLTYCKCDPRALRLGRLVKDWAKKHELVGTTDGCLNSYAYMLLVVFFLQTLQDPVVPNLQALSTASHPVVYARGGWSDIYETGFETDVKVAEAAMGNRARNEMSLAELLLRFFKFYSEEFDWHTNAVSIRLGQPGQAVDKFTLSAARKEQWYIEDPFDLRHNLADKCSVAGRTRILATMQDSLQRLSRGEGWASACPASSGEEAYFMKCKISASIRPEYLMSVFEGCDLLTVHFPKQETYMHMQEAFLEFATPQGRRRAQALSGRTIAEDCQLKLYATSKHSFKEARQVSQFEALQTPPRPVAHLEGLAGGGRDAAALLKGAKGGYGLPQGYETLGMGGFPGKGWMPQLAALWQLAGKGMPAGFVPARGQRDAKAAADFLNGFQPATQLPPKPQPPPAAAAGAPLGGTPESRPPGTLAPTAPAPPSTDATVARLLCELLRDAALTEPIFSAEDHTVLAKAAQKWGPAGGAPEADMNKDIRLEAKVVNELPESQHEWFLAAQKDLGTVLTKLRGPPTAA